MNNGLEKCAFFLCALSFHSPNRTTGGCVQGEWEEEKKDSKHTLYSLLPIHVSLSLFLFSFCQHAQKMEDLGM